MHIEYIIHTDDTAAALKQLTECTVYSWGHGEEQEVGPELDEVEQLSFSMSRLCFMPERCSIRISGKDLTGPRVWMSPALLEGVRTYNEDNVLTHGEAHKWGTR